MNEAIDELELNDLSSVTGGVATATALLAELDAAMDANVKQLAKLMATPSPVNQALTGPQE
jgi:hypothetical protein